MTLHNDDPAPLGEHARGILDAARPLEGLPPERKARVRGRILSAVAAGAAIAATTGEAASAASASAAAGTTAGAAGLGSAAVKTAGFSLFTKIGVSVAIVTISAGGYLWNRAHHDAAPPGAPAVEPPVAASVVASGAPAVPAESSPQPVEKPAEPAPPSVQNTSSAAPAPADPLRPSATPAPADPPRPSATPGSPPSEKPSAEAAEAADSLQEETRLIAAAHAALSRGDAASALTILDEHARRFPRGALAPERKAARAMALCKAGRASEGQNEANALYGEGDKSPVAEKIRRACAK